MLPLWWFFFNCQRFFCYGHATLLEALAVRPSVSRSVGESVSRISHFRPCPFDFSSFPQQYCNLSPGCLFVHDENSAIVCLVQTQTCVWRGLCPRCLNCLKREKSDDTGGGYFFFILALANSWEAMMVFDKAHLAPPLFQLLPSNRSDHSSSASLSISSVSNYVFL